MYLIFIFWALLALPGYAVVRRLLPESRDTGILNVLALSYLLSFGLLAPVSIACYVVQLPLAVFSIACAFAIVTALVVLAKTRADRELASLLRQEPLVPAVLLVALLVMQARVGGYLAGDAYFHVGHVRYLLERGFSNRDIYLAPYHFHAIYHTNILYAFYASLAQLTHQTFLDAWFYTQPWAKLLVAAGHYSLGYALSRKRWVGWLTALTVVTANAGEAYSLYPNTLAVGWLLPMGLGTGLCLLPSQDNSTRTRTLMVLALLGFLMGQVHSLYAVYAGMLLVPLYALYFAVCLLQPERPRWVLWAMLALLSAAPFVLVSKYAFIPTAPATLVSDALAPATAAPAPQPPPAWVTHSKSPAVLAGGGHLEKQMNLNADGRYVFLPEHMGGAPFVVLGLFSLLMAAYAQPDRRQAWLGTCVIATELSLLLFVPSVCALALRLLPEPFALARLSTVLSTLLLVGLAAAVVEVSERLPAQRVLRPALCVAAVFAATRLPGHAPLRFVEHVHAALSPAAERHATLDTLSAQRALLDRNVPRGATVLVDARLARPLVMLCDCFVIAADRGHTRVPDLKSRRQDLSVLNAADTPWPVRRGLLQHYAVHHAVYEERNSRTYRWVQQHGRVLARGAGIEIATLRQ